ncbi:hypothetical protein [Kitasatospora aureofaciens]|uniref:hypothetical protein n=1 Tax=Kitasatospora aureofaciens TaxID=1894 RepID=UPI0033E17949
MSLDQIFSISITIQRAGAAKDRYGNVGLDWSNPTSTTVLGWLDTNQRKMHEEIRNRDESESDGNAFLPAGTDILPTDRLIINGTTYQVYGVPAPVYRPGWGLHHIECRIKRFQG